jgi:hypothetical protein
MDFFQGPIVDDHTLRRGDGWEIGSPIVKYANLDHAILLSSAPGRGTEVILETSTAS